MVSLPLNVDAVFGDYVFTAIGKQDTMEDGASQSGWMIPAPESIK